MSGAIKREQGETFASFTARQRALQAQEKAEYEARIKSDRAMRKARRARAADEWIDFDYSMNA